MLLGLAERQGQEPGREARALHEHEQDTRPRRGAVPHEPARDGTQRRPGRPPQEIQERQEAPRNHRGGRERGPESLAGEHDVREEDDESESQQRSFRARRFPLRAERQDGEEDSRDGEIDPGTRERKTHADEREREEPRERMERTRSG